MKTFCLFLALLALISVPAFAGDAREDLQFSVYAGGINAVTADMTVDYAQAGSYKTSLSASTRGFLAKLVPWQGTFESRGWRMRDGDMRPEQHRSTAISGDETEDKTYRYGRDGTFKALKVIEDGVDKSPDELAPDLVDGTIDALTAALMVMNRVAAEGRCVGESEVFDGDRRFRLHFRHDGVETLPVTRLSLFRGEATRCVVEVEPVAGKWHEKPRGWLSIQEQGRAKGSLPTLWLARLSKDGPAVPVRLRVKTDYGTLFMHLTGYNGKTLE